MFILLAIRMIHPLRMTMRRNWRLFYFMNGNEPEMKGGGNSLHVFPPFISQGKTNVSQIACCIVFAFE